MEVTVPLSGGSAGRDADRQKQDLESTHFVLGYHTSTYRSIYEGEHRVWLQAEGVPVCGEGISRSNVQGVAERIRRWRSRVYSSCTSNNSVLTWSLTDTVVGTTEEQEASIKREPSISFGTDVPT